MMMISGHSGFWGLLSMGLGIVIHVAFAAMVVFSAIWLYKKVIAENNMMKQADHALDILRQRLAKGEISVAEYRSLRKELK
jgi:putative membrane protein